MKTISLNRKANYNYNITEKFEAGLVLTGDEVKSLRNNSVSIKESYIGEKNSELWLFNFHITRYKSSIDNNTDTNRVKKILLSKREMNKLIGNKVRSGYSIVPISLYFNKKGFAKVLIGLGKGKKNIDKRQTIKKREWNIQKQRLLKKNYK